jgi:large subunit ribosomal protein L18
MANEKTETREKRKRRIRKKVFGTTERPRLSVFRSAKHMYAQVVDDTSGKTLVHVSTLAKAVKGEAAEVAKSDAAKLVGKAVAAACKAKGIEKVVFDRNGFLYHGRVKALADAAREAGLQF